jgi:predicted ATPase
VVESGQLLVDDGRFVLAGPLSALEIPDTLQDSLMARLDRLQDLKELAQLASVLGREFDYELLAESYPALTNLGGRLERLVDAGLLFQHGAPPTARYVFRHALLQDAAYGSLLKSRRRQHHERVAFTLERHFTTVIEARPEVAAHHFTEAGLADPAIRLWQRAAEMSLGRSANVEAINHLNKALALLDRLPAGSDRDRKELPLQTSVGAALNTTRGYASPDVERAFARARAICDAIGDERDLFWNIRAQWSFYIVRADFPAAISLGEQLLRVATAGGDPVLVVEAQYTLGTTKFWISDLEGSLQHFEEALAAGTLTDRTALRYTGQHTGVLLLAQLSWLRWLQGFPEDARARSRQALALADEISNPLSVTMALFFSIWVHQFLGERDVVVERAREVIARSREQGLFYELLASLFIGWTMAVSRRDDAAAADEGIRMIRLCLDMNRGSGARLAHTYYLSLLLEACIGSGRLDEARRVLAEAMQAVETTGETFWLPELHRLAGELALASDASDAQSSAEASFRRALSDAAACGARALEARAARSLAALLAS